MSIDDKGTPMAIIITSDMFGGAGITEQEFLVDIACFMRGKKRLSMGKAREKARLNLMEFQAELAAWDIDIHYGEEELNKGLDNLGISI